MTKYYRNFLNFILRNNKEYDFIEIKAIDLLNILDLNPDYVYFLNRTPTINLFLDLLECNNKDDLLSYFYKIDKENFNYEFFLEYENLNIDSELLEYFNYDEYFNDKLENFKDFIISSDDPYSIIFELDLEE